MVWRKPERDVTPAINLKPVTHVNFVFTVGAAPSPLEFLTWLAKLSLDGPRPDVLERQLLAMAKRLQPGSSVLEILNARGYVVDNKPRIPLDDDFRVGTRYIDYIGFQSFRFDGLDVSVDYFNPRNELDIPWLSEGPVYELFATGGVRDRFEDAFVWLTRRVVESWPVSCAFGGFSAFTARFALGYAYGPKHFPRQHGPEAFLWPLTFIPRLDLMDHLTGLPIYRTVSCARGLLIQTFEELHNGYEDRYLAAARGLGLRSLWEFGIGRSRKY